MAIHKSMANKEISSTGMRVVPPHKATTSFFVIPPQKKTPMYECSYPMQERPKGGGNMPFPKL